MREREVHVVAAEHQMIADADTRELRLAVFHAYFDQRQVGGAAADVADQHEARVRQFVGKPLAMMEQPVVERRLRLFKQPQRRQPGHARRFDGQRPRAFVERGGDREHHVLLFERRVGKALIPRRAHVREIARAGFDGRDLVDIVGGAPRQDRRDAIDGGMREPAFRAGDEASGNLRAEHARKPADHDGRRVLIVGGRRCGSRRAFARDRDACPDRLHPASRGPRQLQIPRIQLARRGVIPHRRQ